MDCVVAVRCRTGAGHRAVRDRDHRRRYRLPRILVPVARQHRPQMATPPGAPPEFAPARRMMKSLAAPRGPHGVVDRLAVAAAILVRDRKSTRLNSSHVKIS